MTPTDMNTAEAENPDFGAWQRVRQQLQTQLGSEVFNSWFGRMKMESVSGGIALHSVPTAFLKSWINAHYRDVVCDLWKKENVSILRADIVVRSAIRRNTARPEIIDTDNLSSSQRAEASEPAKITFPPMVSRSRIPAPQPGSNASNDVHFAGSPLDIKYTFSNFIESKSNRMAYAAARSVAEGDGSSVRFNPLFIHASVGLGKTHLLQAIAWEARHRDPSKKVRYLTADYFMWVFAKALHNQTALSLKETLRDIDLLLIDDMQFLQGKAIQAEFCHLLNELIDSAKQVVVAADRPPAELESLNERVRSRLKGGVALDIETPDYELRKSILEHALRRSET